MTRHQAPGSSFQGALLVLVCALGAAVPAPAQVLSDGATGRVEQAQRMPAPGGGLGFRGYGHFELVSMTATETFDAVLGSPSLTGFGGGGEVLGLVKGLFARVALSQMSAEGERAFVFGNDVVPLGIPLTVKIRTVELSGGWRVLPRRSPRVAVYGGGGLLMLEYDESSDFAATGDDVSDSFRGYSVFGGAEFGIGRWLFAGVEGQYRVVPDAIGAGGISDAFNETDLGGLAVRVLFGVRK